MKDVRTVAIILAAGKSERFGENKLNVKVSGEPAWLRSFKAFRDHSAIEGTGIVTSAEMLDECREKATGALFVVEGGGTRTESARIGFSHLPAWAQSVLFHDAARPYVSPSLIEEVASAVEKHGAAFPALPVTDTIKLKGKAGYTTLERGELVRVQTPQGGLIEHFQKAFESAREATDDIALLEAIGVSAFAVAGEESNRKLTVSSDARMDEQRTGMGYDVHRFSTDPKRPMVLGGVLFPGDGPGLEGHSDADALLHAVTDALLGAVGKGDIGDRYSNVDPRWKDADSLQFLQECAKELADEGWRVVNIDITVLAERPKISPAKEMIRSKIAQAVCIEPSRVGVKATTMEGLGAIGRGEGIACFAVATVETRS